MRNCRLKLITGVRGSESCLSAAVLPGWLLPHLCQASSAERVYSFGGVPASTNDTQTSASGLTNRSKSVSIINLDSY